MIPWFYVKHLLKRTWQFAVAASVVLCILFFFLSIFQKDRVRNQSKFVDQKQIYRAQIYELLNRDVWQQNTTTKNVNLVMRSGFCSIVGEACTNNPEDGDKNIKNSLVGKMSELAVMPYVNPPASGGYWAYDSLQKIGIVPQVYAANGVGFQSLSMFNGVWKAFRNVAYLLLVLGIVVSGFLILFRTNLGGKQAVTLESALPNIVLTLLYITFSYAIAGFMIDLMYVIMLLSFEVFGSIGIEGITSGSLTGTYLNSSLLSGDALWAAGGGYQMWIVGLWNIYEIIPKSIQQIINLIFIALYIYAAVTIGEKFGGIFSSLFAKAQGTGGIVVVGLVLDIGSLLGMLIGLAVGGGLAFPIMMLVFTAIVILGLLSLYAKVIFFLIYNYIQIVLKVMFAPLFILPNVIPGNNSFINWVKSLLGHLLVFPLVAILLTVIKVIQSSTGLNVNPFDNGGGVGNIFAPSQQLSLPLLDNINSQPMIVIISTIMLVSIPELVRNFTSGLIGKSSFTPNIGALLAGSGAAGTLISGAKAQGQKAVFENVFKKLTDTKTGGGVGGFAGNAIKGLKDIFKVT